MRTTPGVSVVIPVYESASTLGELAARLRAILPRIAPDHEIVFVNDGSRDGSWQILEELAAQYADVVAIDLMRNYGQHNALLAGIRAARFEVIVTMDDDLQHPPEEIPVLLEHLRPGIDVVYGTAATLRHGIWRNAASQMTKFVLQGAMGAEIARTITSFRVLRTTLRAAFDQYQGPFVSIDVLLTWATNRFTAVRVRHDARVAGRSGYGLRRLLTHATNLMTGFSVVPLQIASLLGFGFTLVGVGLLIYVLGRIAIEGGSVPGFPFLASVIVVFSGVQLFTLGVIGEYLARMHFRLMDRPTYAIRQQTERPPAGSH